MVHFQCACGKELRVRDADAEGSVRCPDCGREMEALDDEDDVAPRPVRTSGKAIASLVLGILSLGFSLLSGIPAIVLGALGLRDIGRSQGRMGGTGLAIAGIVTGSLGMFMCTPILVGLLLPAVQKVREAANRLSCQNNLKQLAIAMRNYHDANGHLPAAAIYSKNGEPLLSWRVALLPYMGHENLYRQFKLDEPWDSPNNIRLLAQIPKEYVDPSAAKPGNGETVYQVFVGEKTAFESQKGEPFSSFTDGIANTFLIVEGSTPVPWTKPADLSYAPGQPLPKLGGHHPGGFNGVLADGSVHFFSDGLNERAVRALVTRNGGERGGGALAAP
jgi:hypothetical protein